MGTQPEWPIVALNTVADFLSGGTPSKARPDYWSGDIPWISAKDMKQQRIRDSEDHISPEGLADGSRIAPKGATLVLVRGMTLISDVPVCVVERDAAFNQDIKAIVARNAINPAFLNYVLLAAKPLLLSYVEFAGHGTGRMPTDRLQELQIPIPATSEQAAIARVLSTLDDKIELNRRMNETLDAMAHAIFKSWFVDFDPVHAKAEGRQPSGMDAATAVLFPDSFDDSAVGNVPTGWRTCTIGDVVEVGGGSTPSTRESAYWDGLIHWATPKDLSALRDPVLLVTERRITQAGVEQIGSRVYPEGTVLLSSRAPIGYLAISEVPVAVNQGMIAMACARNPTNHYMLYWTRAKMDAIESRASGTTFQEISKSSFRSIPLTVPTDDVMRAFTEHIEPLHRQIVANVRQSRTLAAIRDSVLPKLICGEIGVAPLNSARSHRRATEGRSDEAD